MWKSFYAGSELLGFPLFTMFFFIAVFAAVVWRVTRPSSRARLDHDALLPLADDAPAAAPKHETPAIP